MPSVFPPDNSGTDVIRLLEMHGSAKACAASGQTRSRGMTLVEILIALAIASLMTLTGWRAIDALQASRDRVQADATQWQQLDDFFVTLEADLRRTSLSDFSGSESAMSLLQPATDGGPEVTTVRYRVAAIGNASPTVAGAMVRVWREATGAGATPMADALAVSFAYSVDGMRFDANAGEYPRALRVVVAVPGTGTTVERLLALR